MAGNQANIANFFTPLKGPGRSAATLVEDLILFDPRQDVQQGYHLLENGARSFGQAQQIGQLLPDDSCVHDFRLKKRQSAPPAVDARPDSSSVWTVAAICQRCRIHLLLTVDYTAAWKDEPCPTWANPLHYLVRSVWRQDAAYRDLERDGSTTTDEIHVYECSSKKCSAIVTVHLSPPVIPPEAVHVLVDPELLAKRTNAAFEFKAGHTEGMKRPSPLDVLSDLRAYLRNSWTRSSASEISLDNKRFLVRFGPGGMACRRVLESLGFELKPGTSWVVPQPIANDSIPLQERKNIWFDNIELELDTLMEGRPEEEKAASPEITKLEPAFLQMSRVLSSRNYDTDPRSRTVQRLLWNRPRSFTVLGIPEDASDDLVIWAFQRQIMLEHNLPAQTAKLMTALEDIQRFRMSEKLTAQVAIERSKGYYSEQTIANAYRSLGLASTGDVDESTIIGNFEARLYDAPNQEQQMRESLVAIGEYRQSQRLVDFARNTISTYQDAAKFLDIQENTEDAFLVSIYHSKVFENAAIKDMAQKAMSLIADHRNSDSLRNFVANGCHGDLEPPKMDISEAYSCLNLDDRTIEDDAVWVVFQLAMEDGYQSRDKLQQAVIMIAEDRNSSYLHGQLNITQVQQPQANLALTEPVGLANIGNTCYLNSLLQSLFTISTVREIVLNFDDFKQDLTADSARDKHVGQRAITIREIRSAQNFVNRLAELFQQMITASTRNVRPTYELARLALETEQAKIRRRSTAHSDRRPTLGMINDLPIQGPANRPGSVGDSLPAVQSPEAIETLDPIQETVDDAIPQSRETTIGPDTPDDDDNASDKTLVSQDQPMSGNTSPSKVDENLSETKAVAEHLPLPSTTVTSDQTSDTEMFEIPTSISVNPAELQLPPSRTVSPEPKIQTQADSTGSTIQYAPPPGKPPSSNPPPVPPRPGATSALEEYAKQQDVAEVLAHAVIQLSSAIRPVGVDDRKEQQDEVRDTFYGEERKLVLRGSASAQPPVPFLFISFPIHNEPRDLYGAFDNYFDPEEIGTSEIYAAVTKLPPVLCFALTRVVSKLDNEKKKVVGSIKLNNHVEIPTTLYMDRYMDAPSGSVLQERKEQTWQYKKRLRKLKARISQLEPQGVAPADEQLNLALATIQHLAEVGATENINGLTMDPGSVHQISELVQNVKSEREFIRNRIAVLEQQINDSFTDADFRKQEYKLHALFFHRGTPVSGHYWIYIFDHVNETWRKYNDETVTQINNLKEIFNDPRNDRSNPSWSSYSPANPYFLMYVKADRLGSAGGATTIVETVNRNPILPPPPPPQAFNPPRNVDNAFVDEGIDIRPLGSDTPKNYEIESSHHEYAGQPSQMSYLPPDAPRLQGQEPHLQQDSDFASIGSVMQQKGPSTQHVRDTSWDDHQLEQAIQQSLQPSSQNNKAGWDNSENNSVPRSTW